MILINKKGLKIDFNPREVREELLRGTGAVMGETCAIYMENTNFRDQQIAVARSGEGHSPGECVFFEVQEYDQAWRKFVEWQPGPAQP